MLISLDSQTRTQCAREFANNEKKGTIKAFLIDFLNSFTREGFTVYANFNTFNKDLRVSATPLNEDSKKYWISQKYLSNVSTGWQQKIETFICKVYICRG